MIPILYPKTETAFSGYGGQKLTDTISCIVTEERNGIFEVELIYPVDGEFFNAIEMGSFIFCGCSQGVSQPFEIYAASKPIDGKVVYYGQHITYSANYNVIKPFTFAGSAQQIMDKLASERVSGTGKAVTMMAYDIPGAKTYSREYPAGLRSCLGGTEGSLLDLFGGEYEWDYDYTNQRPKITLHNNRGRNHGVKILYGKNLTDLMQEESIQELFTGVVLYWVGDANGVQKCVYSDEVNISSIASYPYHRTLTVDVSGDYDTEPTVATLNAAAAQYLTDNNAGIPSINLTVSFVDLSSTEEYKDKAMLETVNLCDTVEVEFTKLGVSALAKVIKTTWNTLLDRYDSIEIGDAKANLAATIANIDNTIESIGGGIDEIEESIMAQVQRDIAQAVMDATERITGADGGYIKYHFNAQGEPTEMLIMNSDDEDTATKIWRWGINGLGFSADGGENYTSAFTVDGQGRGYLNTQFILASAISSAMIAAGAITTDKLDAGAVTANKIAAGAITASMISGQLTNDQIAGLAASKLSGQISTGTIGWINLANGNFSLAGGKFFYTNGQYIELQNNLSLRLNSIPLAGEDITSQITRYLTLDYLKVIKMPYIVYVFVKCWIPTAQPSEAETIISNLPYTANTPARFSVAFCEYSNTNARVISGYFENGELNANAGDSTFSASFSYPI